MHNDGFRLTWRSLLFGVARSNEINGAQKESPGRGGQSGLKRAALKIYRVLRFRQVVERLAERRGGRQRPRIRKRGSSSRRTTRPRCRPRTGPRWGCRHRLAPGCYRRRPGSSRSCTRWANTPRRSRRRASGRRRNVSVNAVFTIWDCGGNPGPKRGPGGP